MADPVHVFSYRNSDDQIVDFQIQTEHMDSLIAIVTEAFEYTLFTLLNDIDERLVSEVARLKSLNVPPPDRLVSDVRVLMYSE